MDSAYEIALKHTQEAHEAAKNRPEQRELNVRNPAYWLGLGGSRVSSGVSVTPESAMKTSAVWACVRVLAWSLASMPVHTFRTKVGGGSEKAIDLPVYNMLLKAPNPEITAFTFKSTGMVQACIHGNAYAEIEFDNFGQQVALWPIPAWCCRPMRTQNKELYYQVTMPGTGEQKNLQPYRIFHVMGLGTDGMQGLSIIRQHAESIGISIAAEQFGGAFFGNGMNVGGVAEHPGKLTNEGSEKLRRSLNEKYAGLGNSSRLLLLEEGMKYQKVGIPPNEAQFIETRAFQIEDIARMFNVQQHKIGAMTHATFSNIEEQNIEFVTDTILPWAVNWEQEYDRKLLTEGLYSKHNLEGLLRGNAASRADFYTKLFYISSITPNQIMEKEDMNPMPGTLGDRYYTQANMIPVDRVDDVLNRGAIKAQQPARSLLSDAIKRIAEREKQNLIRAYKKNPDTFEAWLPDYYRDFEDFINKQVPIGQPPGFVKRYVEQSKKALVNLNMANFEGLNWVNLRMRDYCSNYKTDDTDIARCSTDKEGVFQENCGAECPNFNGG